MGGNKGCNSLRSDHFPALVVKKQNRKREDDLHSHDVAEVEEQKVSHLVIVIRNLDLTRLAILTSCPKPFNGQCRLRKWAFCVRLHCSLAQRRRTSVVTDLRLGKLAFPPLARSPFFVHRPDGALASPLFSVLRSRRHHLAVPSTTPSSLFLALFFLYSLCLSISCSLSISHAHRKEEHAAALQLPYPSS